jgi:hypothetical protein
MGGTAGQRVAGVERALHCQGLNRSPQALPVFSPPSQLPAPSAAAAAVTVSTCFLRLALVAWPGPPPDRGGGAHCTGRAAYTDLPAAAAAANDMHAPSTCATALPRRPVPAAANPASSRPSVTPGQPPPNPLPPSSALLHLTVSSPCASAPAHISGSPPPIPPHSRPCTPALPPSSRLLHALSGAARAATFLLPRSSCHNPHHPALPRPGCAPPSPLKLGSLCLCPIPPPPPAI